MKKSMMRLAMLPVMLAVLTFTSCQKDVTATRDGDVSELKKTGNFDPLSLACEDATTNSIDLTVTAGTSGAPAGFSVQWMTKAAFDANGGVWPMEREIYETQIIEGQEVQVLVGYTYCEASFSGVPRESMYNLSSGGSVTVTLGMGGTMCDGTLTCDTDYVFRAFAHANNRNFRSAYTIFDGCGTAACPE